MATMQAVLRFGFIGAALFGAACAKPLAASLPTAGTAALPSSSPAAAVSPPPVTPSDRPPTRSAGDSVTTRERSTATIAPGIYFIRHEDAPDTFPQGNTTVIVGDRETLVVDSCYLPSSAKKDIEQIKKWSGKPVRYLVNTHWHYDHTMGNGVYKDAFTGLTIVAHRETQKQIEGYNPQWFAKFPDRAKVFKQRIESGKDADGKPLTDGEIAELKTALAGVEPVWAEFRPLAARRDMTPTLAFERELEIDLGGRVVRIMHLGRGNTAGDAVVYLPRERLLIAGDLLDHPVPYLGGGYPIDLIATLESVTRLDFDTIVPGHGKVLRGRAYLEQVIEFLQVVVGEVDREIHRAGNTRRNLDEVKKAVLARLDVAAWRERFAGDDKDSRDFFESFSLAGLITAAHNQLWPR